VADFYVEPSLENTGVYLLKDGPGGDKPMKNAEMWGVEAEFIQPENQATYITKMKQVWLTTVLTVCIRTTHISAPVSPLHKTCSV